MNDEDYKAATELQSKSVIPRDTIFKVSAGRSVHWTVNMGANAKLYVAGTLECGSSVFGKSATNMEIIVLPGGRIECSGGLYFNTSCYTLTIMPGGTLHTQSDLNFNYEGTVYLLGEVTVEGTVNMPKGMINKGTSVAPSVFYMGKDAVLNAQIMAVSESSLYIENHGIIRIQTILSAQAEAQLYNYHTIYVEEKAVLAGFKHIVLDQATLYCPSIELQNSDKHILLRNGSSISAPDGQTECELLEAENLTIYGGKGERSIVKATRIQAPNAPHVLTFKGHLDVEGMIERRSDDNVVVTQGAQEHMYTDEIHQQTFPYTAFMDGTITYLFDGKWPVSDDFDMNDVVFKVSRRSYNILDATHQVNRFDFDLTLAAVGTAEPTALALMIDGLPADAVQSVTYTGIDAPTHFDVNHRGVESGHDAVVIPLVDEVHRLFGMDWLINTVQGMPETQAKPVTFHVSVALSQPVSADCFHANKLNFFTIRDVVNYPTAKADRREIHQTGFQPTTLAATSLFGQFDDDSKSSKTYVSKRGMPWALAVPADILWAREWRPLNEGYRDLNLWMSEQKDAKDRDIQWWEPNLNATNIKTKKLYVF